MKEYTQSFACDLERTVLFFNTLRELFTIGASKKKRKIYLQMYVPLK